MNWIEASVKKLRARVYGMVTRAVIATVNDALKTQRVQLTIRDEGEIGDNVEHFQPYGLSFVPPEGAEAIALALGGERSVTVAICAHHPEKRPKGSAAGTGGLYTDGVWRVFIGADGSVYVGSDSATHPIPLGDVLKSVLDALTVNTAMGPSSTPLNAATFSTFLSAKHKVE